ncbi:MAG TPA: sulfurtransferase TusA family protein [Planctomycetota bacterium]|nr:sulfurtransferase TusA family protein [Planctomycetota bacterium]
MAVPELFPRGGIPEGDVAERVKRVLETLFRLEGRSCASCGGRLCNHETLACIPSGHADRPICLACLASEVRRSPEDLRDEIVGFLLSKECLTVGWRWANLREGEAADATPRCLWGDDPRDRGSAPGTPDILSGEPPGPVSGEWDAGDLACGDLLLELRFRLDAMAPGAVLRLTARDAGAREDLPAWCRLTGHAVLVAEHPAYWIRRKE